MTMAAIALLIGLAVGQSCVEDGKSQLMQRPHVHLSLVPHASPLQTRHPSTDAGDGLTMHSSSFGLS